MNVLWTDEQDKVALPFLEGLVESLCVALAARFNIPPQRELSIAIVDNAQITLLNQQYRGKDGPTDVLSFCMEDDVDIEDRSLSFMLGDVVISAEMAAEQAKAYGHSLEREVAFLLTHGVLHLLGYEHDEDVGEMGEISEDILAGLGLAR